MAGEAARLSTLCYEVSHHHNATRGNRQQGEAALADHQPCLNRPAAGAASSGILARTSFKRSEIRVQRGSGCWAGPRCILIQNTPSVGRILSSATRSEEHTSELQSRFGISYAVFCLK